MPPLRRFIRQSWLAVGIAAAAILLPAGGPLLLALAVAALLLGPWLVREDSTPGWIPPCAFLLFLFSCGWTVYDQPGGPVALFEDGNLLFPAQTYLAGGSPYLDSYPVHGWGADGGVDALCFRVFGPALDVFRWRRAVVTALAWPALALAALMLFGDGIWAAITVVVAHCLCPFLSERQFLALLALAVTVGASKTGSRTAWILAGALSAWTFFFSLDFGLFLLVGGGLAAALDRPEQRPWWNRGGLLRFGAGAIGASLPLLGRLAQQRALGAFARVSFREIPSTITDIWGLNAGSASPVLASGSLGSFLLTLLWGRYMPSLFVLVLLGLAVATLLFRFGKGVVEPVDRGAVAATAVSVAALRGALGRADADHLALYGILAALPIAWLLYRAAHARRGRALLSGALLLALVIRLEPGRQLAIVWNAVGSGALVRAASGSQPHVFRSGSATVPPQQAEELSALKQYLDSVLAPNETFFDYSNEPALYFLFDRRPPVRYFGVPFYETAAKQREVIDALERQRPPLAILSSGTGLDAFDGVGNRERSPLVAAYLDAWYPPGERISGRLIGRRKESARIP